MQACVWKIIIDLFGVHNNFRNHRFFFLPYRDCVLIQYWSRGLPRETVAFRVLGTSNSIYYSVTPSSISPLNYPTSWHVQSCIINRCFFPILIEWVFSCTQRHTPESHKKTSFVHNSNTLQRKYLVKIQMCLI